MGLASSCTFPLEVLDETFPSFVHLSILQRTKDIGDGSLSEQSTGLTLQMLLSESQQILRISGMRLVSLICDLETVSGVRPT